MKNLVSEALLGSTKLAASGNKPRDILNEAARLSLQEELGSLA